MIIVRWTVQAKHHQIAGDNTELSPGELHFRLVIKSEPRIEVMTKDEAGDPSWAPARVGNHDKTVALVLMRALEKVTELAAKPYVLDLGTVQV